MKDMKRIIACSGGPDSMALLDLCRQQGDTLAIAHVNYKKRESADRDEQIVRDYGRKYDIPVYVDYPQWNHKGNFQAWARDVRYAFFEQCAKDFGASQIEVAHQLDDVLETYLFQIKSHRIPACYGIAKKSWRKGLLIHRPLLEKTKEELMNYCVSHHIPFGIDESNLEDDYTRNQIRHHELNTYTKEEKLDLLKTLQEKNKELQKRREAACSFLSKEWSVSDLLKEKEASFLLDEYLYQKTKRHYALKHLEALLIQIQKDCLIDLKDYQLESFHQRLYCQKKEKDEVIVLESIQYKDYGSFQLKESGKTIEGFYVSEEDFPLTVRSVQAGDRIQLRWGTKKLSRFFVDRKIPKILRKNWKVVTNRKGKVIFVPGIGCDVEHFCTQPSAFMVQ